MKKSIKSAKPISKRKTNKKQSSPLTKEPELEGLLTPEQPLTYFGPPPAIRKLYEKTGYDRDFHPKNLIEQMSKGTSRSEICASWGITYSEFNDWLEGYAELAQAYAYGKPAFDAYYKRALRDAAFGVAQKVRENSLFFMLKNQAGFDEDGGGHEFQDSQGAELEFVDDGDI